MKTFHWQIGGKWG